MSWDRESPMVVIKGRPPVAQVNSGGPFVLCPTSHPSKPEGMESGGISKLVHLVNGAGGSSVLRKPEGRVSDSSSPDTEAEEESNHSSFETSATLSVTPAELPVLAAAIPRHQGGPGVSDREPVELTQSGEGGGSTQEEEAGTALEDFPRSSVSSGGRATALSSSSVLQPPEDGTPAAKALAANAAVPRVPRGSVLMSSNSSRPGGVRGTRLRTFGRQLTAHQAATAARRRKKRRNFQGNVIKGEHEQYTLTIGMMLGIRVAVGRPQQMDDLTLMDFMQVDKYLFPPKGCNKPPHRTPPHHLSHDFKFKDYAPKIFHRIRQLFGVDSASYMLSVSGNYNYLEFMSNSKSGQFFFYSHDGRFMIKTQTSEENKFLRKILPHYYQYVSLNPNTLLTRFYGMHRVKMRHLKRKVHFVIMHSVFDTKEKIYRIYDLKGSTVGRSSGPDKARKEGVVYKDLDLVDDHIKFQLGTKRRLFMEQLERDASFLASLNIMDYSLLIGIYDKTRRDESLERTQSVTKSATGRGGAETAVEGLEDDTLTPLGVSSHPYVEGAEPLHHHPVQPHPHPPLPKHASLPPSTLPSHGLSLRSRRENSHGSEGARSQSFGGTGHGYLEGERPMDEHFHSDDDSDFDSEASLESDEDDIPLPPSILPAGFSGHSNSEHSHASDRPGKGLPTEASILTSATSERRLTHRRDHGVQSRLADGTKGNEVYFVGVIDILQQYNALKRAETFFKSFKYDSRQISAVDPKWYARRFVEFTSNHVQ